jgi:CRISPR system Cascade subunit CasB
LSRADNPSLEYQSWEILAGFGVDLESDNDRLSYGIVAADIARTKSTGNGPIGLGQAIARCYKDGNREDQAKGKLRRLLACDSLHEAVLILRPIFRLIESRSAGLLDYASILKDLQGFDNDERRNRAKIHWAQEFFGKSKEEEGGP